MTFPSHAALLITLGDLVYFIAFIVTIVAALIVSRTSGSPFRFMHLALAWVVAAGLSTAVFFTVGTVIYGAVEGGGR